MSQKKINYRLLFEVIKSETDSVFVIFFLKYHGSQSQMNLKYPQDLCHRNLKPIDED